MLMVCDLCTHSKGTSFLKHLFIFGKNKFLALTAFPSANSQCLRKLLIVALKRQMRTGQIPVRIRAYYAFNIPHFFVLSKHFFVFSQLWMLFSGPAPYYADDRGVLAANAASSLSRFLFQMLDVKQGRVSYKFPQASVFHFRVFAYFFIRIIVEPHSDLPCFLFLFHMRFFSPFD